MSTATSAPMPLRAFLTARLVSGSLIITIPKEHREAIELERGDKVLIETDTETGVVTIVKEGASFNNQKEKENR